MSEYIICYDITNPRRLGRIHRTLKQYAVPLQYSVFLFTGSAAQLAQCLARLQAMVPPVGGGGFAMSMPPSLDLIDQLEAAAREEIETMARAVRGEFPGLEVLGIVAIGAPSVGAKPPEVTRPPIS